MSYFFAICYLGFVILQPGEWIYIFSNKPIIELSLLLGILSCVLTKSERLFKFIVSTPSKLFLAFTAISIISVYYLGLSNAISTVGGVYIRYYLGIMLLVTALDTNKKLYTAMKYIVFFAMIVSYHCINLYHNGVEIGRGIGTTNLELNWRGSVQWLGNFYGTNTTALMLLLPFALSLGLLFKQKSFLNRIYFAFSTALIGYSFMLTHSRGGFLGFLAIIFFFVFINLNLKFKTFAPLALLLFIVIMAVKPSEEGRGIGESSSPERVELLHQGIQMFKHDPFLGVGSGQFAHNNPIRKTAHNIYLNTLAETGLIGFFLFIMVYYLPIKAVFELKNMLDNNLIDNTDDNEFLERTIYMSYIAIIGLLTATFFLSATNEIPYIIIAYFITSSMINNI